MTCGDSLGLDIGSSSIKALVLDGECRVVAAHRCPTHGRPMKALVDTLGWAASMPGGFEMAVGVTGSGRDLVQPNAHVPGINDIVALTRGAEALGCRAATLIEIGGQFARWIRLEGKSGVSDYATNDQCAAGSGSFLEQQASRLRTPVEMLAQLAAQAPRGATIAGRCSVFAKSDMIHLQQNGTPLGELAYGLCLAVARNFVGTILRGHNVEPPVAFLGGGAANAGLVRAFRDVFELGEDDLFVPERFEYFGAAGACAVGREKDEPITVHALHLALRETERHLDPRTHRSLPPLRASELEGLRQEPSGAAAGRVSAFLGADVGSVSTNLVLVGPDGEVLDSIYLATRGRPLDVLAEGLGQFRQRYGDRLEVIAVGATGSGRHLSGAFLGADVVKNEITAQLMGTAPYFPEVESIFEIGGQDSKYIRVRDGKVLDFTMNKICAAGTGSFLEEQAERLGINIIGEFADLALSSRTPIDLGNRCTVFMDSELVFAQQAGAATEDLTAGLAYAIAHNYLEKVVAGRPVGDHIVFQGGVASNRAVVAAFQSLLGRPVHVHPYNRISGAIGAALLAKAAYGVAPKQSRFRGLSACDGYQATSFECKACPNMCQVNRFTVGGRVSHFGDVCERYSAARSAGAQDREAGPQWPNLFRERDERLDALIESSSTAPCRGAIGIPRASLVHELLPFWTRFLRHLGYRVVLSAPSSSALLAKGLRLVPVETCLPIKITFGHVADLNEQGVDAVFLPSVPQVPCPEARCGGSPCFFGAPCIYSEHVPYMIKAAASTRVIAPRIPIGEDMREIARALGALAPQLDASSREILDAFDAAHDSQEEFERVLQQRGQEILAGDLNRAFVALGRPYNLYDPFQNLNLALRLQRFGLPAIPMSFLPLGQVRLGEEWNDLLWKFSRDCIRAAYSIRGDPRLLPIVLSSFGCGPDGFMAKPLEQLLEDRPHLFLEFDEHRGEAGLMTRLEAFLDEADAFATGGSHRLSVTPRACRGNGMAETHSDSPRLLEKSGKLFIPHFADHAYVFSGAFRAAGYESEVLPAPTEESAEAGRMHTTGRECHPYTLLAGDLIALARSGRWRPRDVFVLPGTKQFPCLVSQFGAAFRDILSRLDVDGIEVAALTMGEMMNLLELPCATRLWQGLVAVDLLIRMACERRPYEASPGETNRLHEVNLREIEAGLADNQLVAAVGRCVERLNAIELRERTWRPIIGVAGDMYTRINAFSNDDLFTRIESMGCEVWPASFIVDTVDFLLRQGWGRSLFRRRFGEALSTGFLMLIKEFARARVRGNFHRTLRNLHEPSYDEVTRLAAPYADADANYMILLNIAKMVEFARNGAHGVINAMGFNCMVGTVSAALLNRIRADHGNIPAVNLVYGDIDPAPQRARLEAFVHQVRQYEARARIAGHPTRGSRKAS